MLSYSHFCLRFETGCTLAVLNGGSVSSSVKYFWYFRLPSWRIIRIWSSVIIDHLGTKNLWHVAALNLIILAHIRFLVVAERGALGYDCHDRSMGHGGCGMITLFSRGGQHCFYHHGLAQFVTGCALDPAATYLAYRRSAEIEWSSLCPSDCWFHIPLMMVGFIDYPPLKSVTKA